MIWRRKATCIQGTQSCIIAQHGDESPSGDKSVQILPLFPPCDWSVAVSVRGRGAPLISICLHVNLRLRLRSRASLSAAAVKPLWTSTDSLLDFYVYQLRRSRRACLPAHTEPLDIAAPSKRIRTLQSRGVFLLLKCVLETSQHFKGRLFQLWSYM